MILSEHNSGLRIIVNMTYKLRDLFKQKSSQEPPWKVEALDSLLAVFPKATEAKPSRDGTCLNWNSIKKVTSYKADLFTEDLVCLLFEIETGSGIEVNEEMVGFDEFLEALPDKLPKFPARHLWWGNIVQQPFEANKTVVWERADS